MEQDYKENEILIFTNSSFFTHEWQLLNSPGEENFLSKKQKIVRACWNGLLPELLPECFDEFSNKTMLLWEVTEASHFMQLDYANSMPFNDNRNSINPYLFMQDNMCN